MPISEQMKTPVFVSFCLFIVTLLISLHVLVQNDKGPLERMKSHMSAIDREKSQAELRAQLLAHELADYRQHVATLLPAIPASDSSESSYPLRQLASVTTSSGRLIDIERASGLFEKAKTAFREKDFEGSNGLLRSLLDRYPNSTHVPESLFLAAEGHFQAKEYAESAGMIERMIEGYPENELTGFALLRLGHIFEMQDRPEDAGDIYRSVLANFKHQDLVKQAKASLQAVSL